MTNQGRKPLPTAIRPPLEINDEVLQGDLDKSAALPGALAEIEKNTAALAKTLGYEGPLAPDLLEEGARESLARINFEIFSVGARLLLMKQQCAHGEFLERIERLGVEPRMAQRLMLATRKFPNATTSSHLAALGKSKIFELVVLDDEEADAFANGEEVRGLVVDDVARMSVSALRARLRQADADKDAEIARVKADTAGQLAGKDKLIAEKSKRIAELVEEKTRREGLTDSEQVEALEHELTKHTLVAVGAMNPVRKTVHAARALENCPQGLYIAMQGALDRVIAEAMSIATDYGIQLNLTLWPEEDDLDNPNAGEAFADLDLAAE